jgi:hypothetical protein
MKNVQVTKERVHPALQNMNFLIFFLLLWAIFNLLDPDSYPDLLTRLIRIRSGSAALAAWQRFDAE